MPRFALPTFLAPAPLRAALDRLADAGADGVRLDLRTELKAADLSATAVRELKRRIEEHGLKVGPAVFPTRGALHAGDRLEERVAGFVAALGLAADLGCDTLSVRPFRLPAADDAAFSLLTEVLSDVARAGSHRGVIPCVTPAGDADRWRDLLESVSTGPVGVNFDPAAVLLSGGDPSAVLRTLHGSVRTVTARDAISKGSGGKEVPVGRGEADWEETLAVLAEAGFRGWIACDRTTGPDPFAEAARAVGYLRAVAEP